MGELGYPLRQVSGMLGIPYSNCQYYLSTGLIRASVRRDLKKGRRVLLSLYDCVELSLIADLRADGVPVSRIRAAFETLRAYENLFELLKVSKLTGVKDYYLVVMGDGLGDIAVRCREKAWSLVRHRGQGYLIDVSRRHQRLEKELEPIAKEEA